MSDEIIWLRVVAPLSISALTALTNAAPKGARIRGGGSVELHGQTCNVLEFVVPCAPAQALVEPCAMQVRELEVQQ